MKKIIPFLIILITVSLIGIIYLQYSRFQNMLIVKEEQWLNDVASCIKIVGDDITNADNQVQVLRRQRKQKLNFGIGIPSEITQPVIIADKFTQYEIKEKLEVAFRAKGVNAKKFEFAIVKYDNMISYEMHTPHFESIVVDSVSNKRFIYEASSQWGAFAGEFTSDESLIVVIPDYKKILFQQSYWELVGAIVFTLFIMLAFFLTLFTMLNQRKLSEIKGDFINNMTHEFKTPLATIGLAVDALDNDKVKKDAEKMDYFRTIIREENKRMNKHVETILQAAVLDKQEFSLNKKELHGNDIIMQSLTNFELMLKEKNGTITQNLFAKNDLINADEQHITNLINNLIDNAIKYSKEAPEIIISTQSSNRFFIIKIDDNGIGMNRESVKRIFEKFYRAHTGNLHNVKGFGLGMSYVKTIVDAHKGRIKVESVLGKGSSFTVELPLAK